MKRTLAIFVALVVAVGLTGCGKPPKDVTRKMVLSYFPSAELTLDDIKYLSAYKKDGGYMVNIQAGDALCEMPMIKGDKEWIAKGISCNGEFLSPENRASRKKARIIESLKKEIVDFNANGPETLDNGVRVENFSFDGSRFSSKMTSPLDFEAFTQEIKNKSVSNITEYACLTPEIQEIISVGVTYSVDVFANDGAPVFTITVGNDECRHMGNSGASDSATIGKSSNHIQ